MALTVRQLDSAKSEFPEHIDIDDERANEIFYLVLTLSDEVENAYAERIQVFQDMAGQVSRTVAQQVALLLIAGCRDMTVKVHIKLTLWAVIYGYVVPDLGYNLEEVLDTAEGNYYEWANHKSPPPEVAQKLEAVTSKPQSDSPARLRMAASGGRMFELPKDQEVRLRQAEVKLVEIWASASSKSDAELITDIQAVAKSFEEAPTALAAAFQARLVDLTRELESQGHHTVRVEEYLKRFTVKTVRDINQCADDIAAIRNSLGSQQKFQAQASEFRKDAVSYIQLLQKQCCQLNQDLKAVSSKMQELDKKRTEQQELLIELDEKVNGIQHAQNETVSVSDTLCSSASKQEDELLQLKHRLDSIEATQEKILSHLEDLQNTQVRLTKQLLTSLKQPTVEESIDDVLEDPTRWWEKVPQLGIPYFRNLVEQKYPPPSSFRGKESYNRTLETFCKHLQIQAKTKTNEDRELLSEGLVENIGLLMALSAGMLDYQYWKKVKEDPLVPPGKTPTQAQVRTYIKEFARSQKRRGGFQQKAKQGNGDGRL